MLSESPIEKDIFNKYLSFLPDHLRNEVLKYRKWNDRQNCLIGKILIYLGYGQIEKRKLDFNLLQRDKFGKPFIIGSNFKFNISHTEGVVICAYSKKEVGIDIEKIKEIDLGNFVDIFSSEELRRIERGGINKFYEYWTKKEALAKAVGKGFGIDFRKIKVDDDEISFDENKWNANHFRLKSNYCSIVVEGSIPKIKLKCLDIYNNEPFTKFSSHFSSSIDSFVTH